MCENEYERHETTTHEFTAIAQEVWDLIGVENVFEAIGPGVPNHHDGTLMDARLQELLYNLKNEPTDRVAAYLRYSSKWEKLLPTWEPLLDAVVAQARTKNKEQTVQDIFFGLIPGSSAYDYNKRQKDEE